MAEASVVLGQRQPERLPGGRIVTELWVLEQAGDGIEAKSVHAALEPEAERGLHLGSDIGVAPVQIGLLGKERVQVVAPGDRVSLPGRSAEPGHPVVRGGVHPYIEVRSFAAQGCSTDVWQ